MDKLTGAVILAYLLFLLSPGFAQYSDGKDCILTSNPPIAGRMVHGICSAAAPPRTIADGWTIRNSSPSCEEGWTIVLLPSSS